MSALGGFYRLRVSCFILHSLALQNCVGPMLTVGRFLRWRFNQRTLFNVRKILRGLFASEETGISFSATSRAHAGFCSVRWIPEDFSWAIWRPQREANWSCTSSKGKG
jgi:hypothetical protein